MKVHRRAVMTMSTVVKLMIGIVTGVLVLGTLAWWALEREYGGQDAVSGVAIGRLPDGTAELREITWPGLDPEAGTDYEVTDEGGVVVVRFVDHGGAVLFSGTGDEVTAWLDEQGPQLYTGTYGEVIDHRRSLQESGQSGFPVWLVPIWVVPILTAIIAARREEKARGTGPAVAR
jgi:hypothetical protein